MTDSTTIIPDNQSMDRVRATIATGSHATDCPFDSAHDFTARGFLTEAEIGEEDRDKSPSKLGELIRGREACGSDH